MVRDLQFFGQQEGTLANNQAISFPVNNVADAERYVNFVREQIPVSMVKYGVRKMLKWLVPERGVVEMYINPQNIKISQRKAIKADRTKGGFVVQYWGEELATISISGHTGSSGIEGINILDDVYRGEQLAFDVIALESMAKAQSEDEQYLMELVPGLGELTDFLKDMGEEVQGTGLSIPKPTLGFYASTVEMYWMGKVYRGFFESLDVSETTSQLGLFEYNISFKATQIRGSRRNYLPWQRSATAGPSNSATVPLTFSGNTIGAGQRLDPAILQQEAANLATTGHI